MSEDAGRGCPTPRAWRSAVVARRSAGHASTSTAKTRRSRSAQRQPRRRRGRTTRRVTAGRAAAPGPPAPPRAATLRAAPAPPDRRRGSRAGRGTSTARRARNARGGKPTWVVPSAHGRRNCTATFSSASAGDPLLGQRWTQARNDRCAQAIPMPRKHAYARVEVKPLPPRVTRARWVRRAVEPRRRPSARRRRRRRAIRHEARTEATALPRQRRGLCDRLGPRPSSSRP